MNENSIAYTKWNCKYNIVFTPKSNIWRIKKEIGAILKELSNWKGVEIIEAHTC